MSRYDSSTWVYAKHFDLDSMISNITAVLSEASADEIANGRHWYKTAAEFCHDTAEAFDVSFELVTAVTSALSPGNKWEINKRDVTDILANGESATSSTYKNNFRKALKIVKGILSPSEAFSHKPWNKTASFYDNILQPLNSTAVTLDRHATRVCHGYYLTADDAILYSNTRAKYTRTAEAFRLVARRHDLRPSQCQAITWVVYKRLFVDIKNSRQDIPIIL